MQTGRPSNYRTGDIPRVHITPGTGRGLRRGTGVDTRRRLEGTPPRKGQLAMALLPALALLAAVLLWEAVWAVLP
jgi:hypothetical protein